jgi:hypothetical protein
LKATTQSTAIFRQPSPEELELRRRRAELAALRVTLADREATLAALRAQLFSFEGRYIRQVGLLYTQLDEWHARIAELNPSHPIAQPPNTTADTPPPIPQPNLDLRALFRELAKRIHPDFAKDHHDERQRTHLMAQANDAYNRDDAAILQRMLNGYDPSLAPGTTTIAAALSNTLTQISQTETDIAIIDTELETLAKSDMADLRHRTILAATNGRDLLAEIAAQVKGTIGLAMRRYELDLGRLKRKQSAFNPDPLLSAEAPSSR